MTPYFYTTRTMMDVCSLCNVQWGHHFCTKNAGKVTCQQGGSVYFKDLPEVAAIDEELKGIDQTLKALLAQREEIQRKNIPKKRKGCKEPITR